MATDPSGELTVEAFEQLFVLHAAAVHRFCARRTGDLTLAEDLTSVTFLEAWRHRDRLVPGEDALPWLLGVAVNVTRNMTRSRRRYADALARLPRPADEPDHADAVAERATAEATLDRAREALQGLTRKEQDVFVLVCWQELSYEQTATALGIPIGTVRSRLTRARRRLRETLPALDPSTSDVDFEVL